MTAVGEAIRRILGDHSAALVDAFYNSDHRFAGATFDTLEPVEPDAFTASDVLATSLLDVPFLPRAVRRLLDSERDEYEELLRRVPSQVDLWAATDEQLRPAYDLWAKIKTLDGVGPTRASKLMARKRPRLIPVIDSVIRAGLGIGNREDSWQLFREALSENEGALLDQIEELRPSGLTHEVSTLRLLDSALWMNLSGSVHVRPFRTF